METFGGPPAPALAAAVWASAGARLNGVSKEAASTYNNCFFMTDGSIAAVGHIEIRRVDERHDFRRLFRRTQAAGASLTTCGN